MTATSEAGPKILDLRIGLDATGMRREFDSLGDVEVPAPPRERRSNEPRE
jgi:hypothetical protein